MRPDTVRADALPETSALTPAQPRNSQTTLTAAQARCLTSLSYDTLTHILSFLHPCSLAPVLLTHSALYAAGTPHLLDTVSLKTFTQITALAALFVRLPILGLCVRELHIGQRDPNTHRDAAVLLAEILAKTRAVKSLQIDAADDLLRHPAVFSELAQYKCIESLALHNSPYSGYPRGSVALLAALPLPCILRRLEMRHVCVSLSALQRFDALEALTLEGETILTNGLRSAQWPAVRTLVLRNCRFSHHRLARAFPGVTSLRACAGGLPYLEEAVSQDSDEEDIVHKPFDGDEKLWPALVSAEVDLWALVLSLPDLRVPHVRLTTPLGPVAKGITVLAFLKKVEPSFVSLVVGRELEPEFWVALAESVQGLRGVEIEMVWDWSWDVSEMLSALTAIVAALNKLPRLNVLRVHVASYPFTTSNNAHEFSFADRGIMDHVYSTLAHSMHARVFGLWWGKAGWAKAPAQLRSPTADEFQLVKMEGQTMEEWAQVWKRNPDTFEEMSKTLIELPPVGESASSGTSA